MTGRAATGATMRRRSTLLLLPRGLFDALAWVGLTVGVGAGSVLVDRGMLAAWGLWLLTLVGIALWVLAYRVLEKRRQTHGTLYYLRALAEGMPDYHERIHEESAREVLDVRTVTEWLPEASAMTDARQVTGRMRTELQRAVNDDSNQTGHAFAPNMLMPVALALGFEFMPPVGSRLREHVGNPSSEDSTTVTAFEFELPTGAASWRSVDTGPASVGLCEQRRQPARSVHLSVQLTGVQAQGGGPREWDEPLSDDPWSKRCDVIAVLGVRAADGRLGPCVVPESGDTAPELAATVARAIRDLATEHPDAVLVVTGRMSKTVAFAAGSALAAMLDSRVAAQRGLWSRLVLMAWDGTTHYPMWVRDSQANPFELLKAVGYESRPTPGSAPPTAPETAPANTPDVLQLVNLTPHPFVLAGIDQPGPLAPGGPPARVVDVRSDPRLVPTHLGEVPVCEVSPGEVVDLPEPVKGTLWVVSRVTALAATGRDDVVFPLDEVRDADGRVVACRVLGQIRQGAHA